MRDENYSRKFTQKLTKELRAFLDHKINLLKIVELFANITIYLDLAYRVSRFFAIPKIPPTVFIDFLDFSTLPFNYPFCLLLQEL